LKGHGSDSVAGGRLAAHAMCQHGRSWRKQTESKDLSYVSPKTHLSIWTDHVSRSDRSPGMLVARDVAGHERTVFGARVDEVNRERSVRAQLQRLTVTDAAFGAVWRGLTPAAANALVWQLSGCSK